MLFDTVHFEDFGHFPAMRQYNRINRKYRPGELTCLVWITYLNVRVFVRCANAKLSSPDSIQWSSKGNRNCSYRPDENTVGTFYLRLRRENV